MIAEILLREATAKTKGLRPYSTAKAPCARSWSLSGRPLTDRSIVPSSTALMPPLLPSRGTTTISAPGWFFRNASPSKRMVSSAAPMPPTLTVSAAAGAANDSAISGNTQRRTKSQRPWGGMVVRATIAVILAGMFFSVVRGVSCRFCKARATRIHAKFIRGQLTDRRQSWWLIE